MANGNLLKQAYQNSQTAGNQAADNTTRDPVMEGVASPLQQSFIEGAMGLGWSLLGSGLAAQFDDPRLMEATENAGAGVVQALKQEWYQSQADNFKNTHGKQYQESLQNAQKIHSLATTPKEATDPATGERTFGYMEFDSEGNPTGNIIYNTDYASVMQHLMREKERFFQTAHQASMSYMDAAGQYGFNPIIGQMASRNLEFWREHSDNLTKGRQEAQTEAALMKEHQKELEAKTEQMAQYEVWITSLLNNEYPDNHPYAKVKKALESKMENITDPDTGETLPRSQHGQIETLQLGRMIEPLMQMADKELEARTKVATLKEAEAVTQLRNAQALESIARASKAAREVNEKAVWKTGHQIPDAPSIFLTQFRDSLATVAAPKQQRLVQQIEKPIRQALREFTPGEPINPDILEKLAETYPNIQWWTDVITDTYNSMPVDPDSREEYVQNVLAEVAQTELYPLDDPQNLEDFHVTMAQQKPDYKKDLTEYVDAMSHEGWGAEPQNKGSERWLRWAWKGIIRSRQPVSRPVQEEAPRGLGLAAPAPAPVQQPQPQAGTPDVNQLYARLQQLRDERAQLRGLGLGKRGSARRRKQKMSEKDQARLADVERAIEQIETQLPAIPAGGMR